MKVRKKPEFYDAVQWFPGTTVAGVEPFTDADSRVEREMMDALPPGADPNDYGWCPDGIGGRVVLSGDWILTAASGARWPCNAQTFATYYEPVEEPT